MALIYAASVVYSLQRLLYGPLRPIEVEQLYEKAWLTVTETLLAMTIFREDIGARFFCMFLSLLAGRIWEWIGEGRVEFLEQQPPPNPVLFHSRLAASLLVSILFDAFMLRYCVLTIMGEDRPGMMVMFGFEYALLSVTSASLLLRYGMALSEVFLIKRQVQARLEARRAEVRTARERRERDQASGVQVAAPEPGEILDENDVDEHDIDVPGWEDKGRWIFYLDLLTGETGASACSAAAS